MLHQWPVVMLLLLGELALLLVALTAIGVSRGAPRAVRVARALRRRHRRPPKGVPPR